MTIDSLAVVGAAGGVGTTRSTMECATLLASEGHDIAVLDAAYATQGLSDRTPGRIDPDMTAVCIEDRPLEEGLVDRDIEGAGRLAVCPANTPFERLARAKTADAAEIFERKLEEAARSFDHVLVDTPPIAANQSVAAATSAEAVAIVCDAPRAEDAVPRTRDRLADIGVDTSTTVVTRAEQHPDADVTIPTLDAESPAVTKDPETRSVVAAVLETTVGVTIAPEDEGGLREQLPI
jgi:septum site-determining protein MinD